MSVQDKGGRNQWAEYTSVSSGGAGSSGSGSARQSTVPESVSSPTVVHSTQTTSISGLPSYQSGYVPANTPPPRAATVTPVSAPAVATSPSPTTTSAAPIPAPGNIVTRVRALHTFEPTEPGELAFEKGDIIKVVDRGYKDWWRGQIKGRTGIFPVNYVVRVLVV